MKSACQILATPFFARGLSAATLVRHPYLQNARGDRVTIRWTTLENAAGAVEFFNEHTPARVVKARNALKTPVETGLDFAFYQHTATVTALAANTEYSYRVLMDGEFVLSDAETQFRTRGASQFQFLAFGDSGIASPEQGELARRMRQDKPALVIHTGDLVYPTGTFERYQTRYFDFYDALMKRVPFFPSPGNHDYYHERGAPYRAVHEVPTESVDEPDHGRYYSFDWGNVHFVSLDSNDPLEQAALGNGRMLEWLERDLRQSRQFWRVAYFHHPPYATGPNAADPLSLLARQRIAPILEKYRVPLVLSGHEHSYQRTWNLHNGAVAEEDAGCVYVTTGGGGANLYPVSPAPHIAFGESVHHYVRAEVSGASLALTGVGVDGREFDTIRIAPRPAPARVLDAAAFGDALAAGGLITIAGWHFSLEDRPALRFPLPSDMAGVSVALNGSRIPLLYVSPTQINAQLPFGTIGPGILTVTTPRGATDIAIEVAEVAPAIFAEGVSHANGSLVTADDPAQPGEPLILYGTGLGPVNGAIAAGHAAPLEPRLVGTSPTEVYIGPRRVAPEAVELMPGTAGVYRVRVRVPEGLRGAVTIQVSVAGRLSNRVVVSLQSPAQTIG